MSDIVLTLHCPGCEFVVALTHMRTDNDVRLAEKVPEIDLILGGHNLVYEKRKVKSLPVALIYLCFSRSTGLTF